ncbi:MAG: hypothetical protein ACI82F_002797 [Planctomycetota bacterium]|jgi:hypothetical protein
MLHQMGLSRVARCLPCADFLGMLGRAESELVSLRRRELGKLFMAAALLSQGEDQLVRLTRQLRIEVASLGQWRALALRELRRCDHAERCTPVVRLLARMLAVPVASWPRPTFLAALGGRLAKGPHARLAEAHVLFGAGRRIAAEGLLRDLSREHLSTEANWSLLSLLGRCHLAAGRTLFALGAFEAASELPTCGIGALVESLALARVLGDEGRMCRAAARLDLLTEPGDPEFRAAFRDLHLRVKAGTYPRAERSTPALPGESPAESVLALVTA